MTDQNPTTGGGGGFMPSSISGGLPSPAPSSASSSRAAAAGLPHPRSHSLQPGSNKEDMVRRYVEDRLLQTLRRYVRKFGDPDPLPDDGRGGGGPLLVGYKTFGEVARDLDGVVNVLWLSGTPSLQIPFLLRVASDFTQYVRSFPPSPKPSFQLLGKLDHCLSSLLRGHDVDSREPLPGFDNGPRAAGLSVTDMVRCRSIVEHTRVLMVEVMSAGDPVEEEGEDEDETEDETTGDEMDEEGRRGMAWDIDEDRLHLDAARIYENTIIHLNERLGDPLDNRRAEDAATNSQNPT